MKNEFKTGDIFCDDSGYYGDGKGNSYRLCHLFEYDEFSDKGEGFRYSGAGKKYGYYWAHPEKEKLIKNIAPDILYSFKHGSHDFKILESEYLKLNDHIEIIRKSDFKYISEGDMHISSIIEGIENFDDIKDHWELLKKYGVTPKIAEICIEKAGGKIPPVHNGEIGIHNMNTMTFFYKYFSHIESRI